MQSAAIPVQYAKRVVGRKMYGGQSTHLPIKVNMSGVLPIIFAQSIASLPATIFAFMDTSDWGGFGQFMLTITSPSGVVYGVCYFLLIIAFSYFYAAVQYNPIEIANNLKKNGGFIPGFRPGRPTADFIQKVILKDHPVRRPVSGGCRSDAADRFRYHRYDKPVDRRYFHHHCGGRCFGNRQDLGGADAVSHYKGFLE